MLKAGSYFFAALLIAGSPVHAQLSQGPQPISMPPPVPAPQDIEYPGTITLAVDATDIERQIFNVYETIPVKPGPLTLLFPEWLPGNHRPAGRVDQLAGLTITGGGQRIAWMRNPANVYAFHLTVPEGVTTIEASFQWLTPVDENQGRIVMTPEMLNLQWEKAVLYPAGYFARRITVQPSLRLPGGWQWAGALDAASQEGADTTFKPVSLETLVDSPLFAGEHYLRLELDPGGKVPVTLNIFADEPKSLTVSADQLKVHRELVDQAYKLFGSHHYDRYDFLLALSEKLGGIGLEHHRSSENSLSPDAFTAWDKNAPDRDLLPHEFTHSWNGKFRRPADLWTPNFNVPMRDGLLWVYEGQTQYWGIVLAARAGFLTKQEALDSIAQVAAVYDARIGRTWKPLQDTTNDPITGQRRPQPWRSWQRSEDYYSEGQLVWLDADTLIREKSRDRRSLDDFAKAFFGIDDGSYVPVTYRFEDVVEALDKVEKHDWAGFLRARLDGYGPSAPLDGLKRGGYALVFKDKPSEYMKAALANRKSADFTYSLGMSVRSEGKLSEVLWDGPAYRAGLTASDQLVAVNNLAYAADRLEDAVTAAKDGTAPIELLVKDGDRYRTVKLDYHGGLRYPHLERIKGEPARLDDILKAR